MDKRKEILHQAKKLRELTFEGEREIYDALRERNLPTDKLLSHLDSWSELYSLSFIEFLAQLVIVGGLYPMVDKSTDYVDPLDAKMSFLDQIRDFEFSTETLEQHMGKQEAERKLASYLIALMFNVKAFAHRNRPINTMIEQIRNRVEDYEEVIFEAVSIDASVVSNPEIADFISVWTFERNEEMLGKLSKAIVGKYPRGKRTVGLDDFRIMTAILEEVDGKVDVETVHEMSQLFNLIAEGKDLGAAIQKHLQTRKRDTRKSKTQTTS